jgi:hypothetical protein
MSNLKLEVGKGYLNGYGRYVRIISKFQWPDMQTVFYDAEETGYSETGQDLVFSEDPVDPSHLVDEAVILTKLLYDGVMFENPKRARKTAVIAYAISIISAVTSISNIYIFMNYCN